MLITRPSIAVKPMVVATLTPARSAHMLAQFPRWATTVRPAAAAASTAGSAAATYSQDRPWSP
jgi:hypothetical protein